MVVEPSRRPPALAARDEYRRVKAAAAITRSRPARPQWCGGGWLVSRRPPNHRHMHA